MSAQEYEHDRIECELPDTTLNGEIHTCDVCGREWFYENGWFLPEDNE